MLRSPAARLLLVTVSGLVAVTLALCATAWIQDDGYISLRCARNLVELGELTWNPGQRVQVYVHPLWILVLAAGHALIGNGYYAALVVGWLLTLATWLVIARRLAPGAGAAAFALICLLLSKAFVDFSTSAIENPLSHLLVSWFAVCCLTCGERPGALRLATALFSLIALARVDLVVLVGPALLAMASAGGPLRDRVRSLVIGALPLVVWCLFALFYFGTIVPCPAAAKVLSTTYPRDVVLGQGVQYLVATLTRDPLTLLVIAVGAAAGLLARDWRARGLGLGVVCYVGYVVWIGGCFMSGRFFTCPLVAALALLLRGLPWHRHALALAAAAAAALVGSYGGLPNLMAGRDLHDDQEVRPGVYDCRAYYYPSTGLLARERLAHPERLVERPETVASEPQQLIVAQAVGLIGYLGSDRTTVVDPLGLCDALLARLPPMYPTVFRPGHIRRHLPAGYLASLALGANRIADPSLARYWDNLDSLIRQPLWSVRRLRAIWAQVSGEQDRLLQEYLRGAYVAEQRWPTTIAELAGAPGPGTPWHAPGVVHPPDGILLRLDGTCARLELCLDQNNDYRITLLRGGEVLHVAHVERSPRSETLRAVTVDLPGAARLAEHVAISRLGGDGIMALGRVRAEP